MADESGLEEPWFTNGDIRLHAVAAGPQNGPVVILLHGFPQFWYAWHNQIAPLADAGLRVIAPDQRGSNTSSKPPGIPAATGCGPRLQRTSRIECGVGDRRPAPICPRCNRSLVEIAKKPPQWRGPLICPAPYRRCLHASQAMGPFEY